MEKKKIIIALFGVIAIFLTYYFFSYDYVKPGLESEKTAVNENRPQVPVRISREQIKNEYEDKFRVCLKNYEATIQEQINIEDAHTKNWNEFFAELNRAKEDLLLMTVPEDFKSSHLQTVLAVSRINEIFQSQDEENFNTAKELLAQVKIINTELIN